MFRRNGYDDSLMDDQPKPNPYPEGSAEWEDYKVGYEEGAAYCRLAYEGAPDPEY